MKKKVKFILLGILVLVISSVVVVSALQPLVVDAIVVEPSQAEVYFTELGHVRGDRQVSVFSLVGGEIISVHVAEGQFVQEGDVLVTIDSSDILHEIEQIRVSNLSIYAQIDNLSIEESQARANLISGRNLLQGELGAIDAQERMSLVTEADQQRALEENIRLQNIIIEQSITNVQNALSDFESARILYDAGFLARVELEAAENMLENHRTALATSEQTLEIISSGAGVVNQSEHFAAIRQSILTQISDINRSHDQLSTEPMRRHFYALIESNNLAIENLERRASNSTIVSPVSGTIVNLHANYTNILNPAMPVADIRTETDNLVETFVSTANINGLSAGDIVDLTFIRQDGDAVYSGVIHSIDDRAEATISILGVEERRVRVLIEPDSYSGSFRSGFDVDVRFVTYSAENRIAIPRTAIFQEAGQDMVYVVENGVAVPAPVALGARLRTETVVESGLNVGDIVIRNAHQDGLNQGTRVAY